MSENRIAASTPSRSIGCNVTFAASSGVRHTVREIVRLPHLAVFRQVAAGLAHQPHGRTHAALAAAG
jgi:hypothetical protein